MKVYHTSVIVLGEERLEISDVTKIVHRAVEESGVRHGIAIANALHTTCALFINEFQASLVDDLKALIGRLMPPAGIALLGRSVALGVTDGHLVLGRFQSIIFAELDGPRQRDIAVQVIGE
ncbi:MAG TPA: YjbQ family protein [Methylomirabilota bacterium]|jgi:thiamine phosphate synthase YjbQ (UPF0047 family)